MRIHAMFDRSMRMRRMDTSPRSLHSQGGPRQEKIDYEKGA